MGWCESPGLNQWDYLAFCHVNCLARVNGRFGLWFIFFLSVGSR